MSTVVERPLAVCDDASAPAPALYVVWFDAGCRTGPCWWWEEPGPQPLADALDQSAEMRQHGWTTLVCAAQQNPRPDGRWDNPCGGCRVGC